MPRRIERVNSVIKEELGKILLREVEVPGALITIVGVETSRNLSRASVGVSVFPSEKEGEVIKVLKYKSSYLNRLLEDKIRLMPMPRIIFALDRGPEQAARVEELLRRG